MVWAGDTHSVGMAVNSSSHSIAMPTTIVSRHLEEKKKFMSLSECMVGVETIL